MNKDNRTDEELNRIIAEWCGWVPSDGDHKCRNAWLEITGEDWPIRPPNYCRDLNAVHEAESKWCEQDGPDDASHQKYVYGSILYDSVVPRDRQPFRATARQRAEALVRVIEVSKQ